MRIISGKFRGKLIQPPKGLPVRPTTDLAKEALFNILQHRIEFRGLRVLDCFAGTGNVSFEFISRGVEELTAVDADARCVQYIARILKELGADHARVVRANVERYLAGPASPHGLIFMDPPYAMAGQNQLVERVLQGGWLAPGGLLVLEHASQNDFSSFAQFAEMRKYGGSSFSFFEQDE